MMLNLSRDTHGVNRMSFTQCQFENWSMIAAYDCMVMHHDVYLNNIMKRKKKKNCLNITNLSSDAEGWGDNCSLRTL